MPSDELVEAMARAVTEEIGWGAFSHFDPGDVRRVCRAALAVAEPAIRADERAWQPIEASPRDGTKAILYFPQHAHDGFDGIDYRYRLAIYRNGEWRDQGTNHYSFEGVDLAGDDKATHWRPLPEPPAIRAGQGERG